MSGETIATCSRDFDCSLSQRLVLMAARSWSVTLYKVPCWKARNTSKQDRQTKRITGHFKGSKLSNCLVQVPFFFALQHGGFVPPDWPPGKDPFKQLNSFNFTLSHVWRLN